MANAKPAMQRTLIDAVRDDEINARRLAGLSRGLFAGIAYASSQTGGSGRRGEDNNVQNQEAYLRTAGDTMVGPIAYYPVAATIATGVLDISRDTTSNFTSYVLLSGEGGGDDTLTTITGAAHAGQILYIQPILTTELTVTQTGGNIELPGDGSDVVVNADGKGTAVLKFIFDISIAGGGNVWVLVSNSEGGGGGSVSFPITPTINDRGSVGSSTESIDLSLTTGHVNKMTLTGDITIALNNPPSSGTQIEFELEFLQDGTGGHTVTFPGSVVETVAVDETADALTIITFRTNDGGSAYHAITTLAGAITGGGGGGGLDNVVEDTTPELGGNLDFLNLDAENIDRLRFAVSSGTVVSAGDPSMYLDGVGDMVWNVPTGDFYLYTIQDTTIAKIDDGDVQFIGLTGVMSMQLINRDSAINDLDQIGAIAFRADDDAGGENISTYVNILAVADDVSSGTTEGTMHLQVAEGGSLTTYLSLNKGRSQFIDVARPIEMEGTTTITMVGGNIIMGNNDVNGLNALGWTDAGGQIAGSASAPHMNFVLTGDSLFRFTTNATDILDIDDTSGIVVKGTHNIVLGNNNITGLNQLAFTDDGTITDSTTGLDFAVPDATDSFRFTIDGELALDLEKFFANWGDTAMQMAERVAPSTPAANDVYFYAKDNGGTSGLFWKDDGGTEHDLSATSSVQKLITEGDSKVEVNDSGTGSVDIFVDSLGARKFWFTATEFNMGSLSILGLNILQGKDTANQLQSLSTGWILATDAADNIGLKFGANERWTFSDTLAIFGDDLRFQDTKGVRANSLANNYMYFTVAGTEPTTMGDAANVGSLTIPYKEDTDDSPSASTLNDWFGDNNGCIGVQFDNDTPDVHTLWVKSNGTWHKVVLT